jgi:uncharacterized protein
MPCQTSGFTTRLIVRGLDEFHARGLVLAAGPLGNPPEGAMGVFTTREAAEEFIQGDPFVINGLVSKWRLVEWNAVFI